MSFSKKRNILKTAIFERKKFPGRIGIIKDAISTYVYVFYKTQTYHHDQ
jgi:hypothetical protein